MKLRMKLARIAFRDAFWQRLAWLLPRRLVYWASIRLMVHATRPPWGDQVVPELEPGVALTRWESQYRPELQA